jgi:predicted metal-dependent phosphoesterase TrpH
MAVNLAQASILNKPAAQDRQALRQVFQTIDAQSCPHSYNFHMHTIFSDGRLKPETLLEQASEIGLKGLAITDHHSIGGYHVAQSWLDQRSSSNPTENSLPHLWTGVEINAGLLGCEVHILAYAFDPHHSGMKPYLQGHGPTGEDYKAGNIITAIHEAGGLAVLAHPCRYSVSTKKLIPAVAEMGIDGVEAYYAYNNPNPWRPSPKQTEMVKELSCEYGLLTTCGTDTHGQNLLQRL